MGGGAFSVNICGVACFLVLLGVPEAVWAKTIRLDDIVRIAVARSYDRKVAEIDVEAHRYAVDEVLSSYFPVITAKMTNEYFHDLQQGAAGIVSVGGQVIDNNGSAYQHSVGLNFKYTLYDSGIRGMRYENAKRDVTRARVFLSGGAGRVKREVLQLYGQGLSLQKRITARSSLISHRKEIFALTQRMFRAGRIDKVEVTDSAIDLADTVNRVDGERLEFQEVLSALSFYTGEDYDPDAVYFEEIPESGNEPDVPDIGAFPDIVALDYEIEKKQVEYEMIKKQRIPTISFYSSYTIYGRNPSSVEASFRDMEQRNASVGIVVDLKIFEGFAGKAREGRARQEILRLQILRDKRVAELAQEVATLATRSHHYEGVNKTWHEYEDAVNSRTDMIRELEKQKFVDRIFILQQLVDQAEDLLDIELKQVEQAVTARHLHYLAESEIQ